MADYEVRVVRTPDHVYLIEAESLIYNETSSAYVFGNTEDSNPEAVFPASQVLSVVRLS